MDARTVRLIEQSVERTAAALFGGAVGYAVYAVAGTQLPRPIAIGCGMATLLVAAIPSAGFLRRIGADEPRFEVAAFDVHEVEPELAEEEPSASEPLDLGDALELNDILAEPAPESRVVRMFAPEAMPVHSGRTHVQADGRAIPDAARDLYQALADLRRSLR
ncbi:MAG TPA: hypothetical protein VFW39_05570 [Sphingomicrobium sp.]|nr:hypothetical protein [Sphingomicrobium sp.]